jgi:hypothetical protein
MLIPRFSLRWLLLVMTLCAGLSLILSQAIRGHAWAIGASAALGSLAVVSLLHVLAFSGAWSASQFEALAFSSAWLRPAVSPFARSTVGESPFAAAPIEADATRSNDPPPLTG